MIKFIGSFNDTRDLPRHPTIHEYAFVGRSNVGKSSLVNAVVGSKVAMVSNTPGKTRMINLFNQDDKVWIVDLPGYGYARVSKDEQLHWLNRLERYLSSRSELKMLFILVDSRHGLKDLDKVILNFCKDEKIPFKIIYTKCDKKDACKFGNGIITSSTKKIGISEIQEIMK